MTRPYIWNGLNSARDGAHCGTCRCASARREKIARDMADAGANNKQIAAALGVTVRSAQRYLVRTNNITEGQDHGNNDG